MAGSKKVERNEEKPPREIELMDTKLTEYQEWFEMIVADDADDVMRTLSQCMPEKKRKLLNGQFLFHYECNNNPIKKCKFLLKTPLCIAATSQAVKAVSVFLATEDFNLMCTDIHDYNILHALVGISVYYPEQEEHMVDLYKNICSLVEEEDLLQLHHMEDDMGFRPLEFSAQQGAFRLMMAFFNTTGVYLTNVQLRHSFRYLYYDITDYESTDKYRWERSPVAQLLYLDESKLKDSYTGSLFQRNSLIHTWTVCKRNVNFWFVLPWCFFTIMLYLDYFVYDSMESWVRLEGGITTTEAHNLVNKNQTLNYTYFEYCPDFSGLSANTVQIMVLVGYAQFYWCVMFISDVVDLVKYCRNYKFFKNCRKSVKGTKRTVRNAKLERTVAILTIYFIGLSMASHGVADFLIVDLARVYATCCLIVSMLYFIRLLPGIGHFVSAIQIMFRDLVNFMMVFAVVLLIFSQMLLVFVNTNSNEGCVVEFSTLTRSAYSVILTMQNVLTYTAYDMNKGHILLILHVCLIFILSILLVNFLIAIMSASVSRIAEHAQTIADIEWLSVILTMEDKFRKIFRLYYVWMIKRHFVTKDGCVYIVVVEPLTTGKK